MANQSTAQMFGDLTANALERLKQNNFDPKALRTNRTLPKDAWKEIDDQIYKIARRRFQAIQALQNEGLEQNLGGLHVLFDMWEQVSDFGEVTQSMDFQDQAPGDQPDFQNYMIPIPLTHGDFQLGARKLMALENKQNVTVDSAMISQITRHVTAKLEDTLFHGTDVTLNGNPAPGLLTHDDSINVTSDGGWTGSWGSNPGDIYEDIKHLIQTLKDNRHHGPLIIFLANDAYEAMNIPDPEGSGDLELMDRIENMAKVGQLVEVDQLDDNYVVALDPVEDIIQLPYAADLQAVEWETHGGYVTNYKIFSAMAPRVMSDEDGNAGICYATDA